MSAHRKTAINFSPALLVAPERPALESVWIQRLKTALPGSEESHREETLQIPLKELVLDGRQELDQEHNQVVGNERFSPRIDSQIDGSWIVGPKLDARSKGAQRSPRGFGSFRVKNVKFRKPPLPPSSKPGSKAENLQRRKEKILASKWSVHGVDVRLEQQLQDGSRKDLLAEFASRLDIREKPTPVGTFHVVDRKKLSSPITNKSLLPCLTPVVVSPALIAKVSDPTNSTTASLPPEILQLESTKRSVASGRTASTASVQANRSHVSTRTLSTACCGSSPFPLRTSTISGSTEAPRAVPPERCARIDQDPEACLATGKRRSDASVTLSQKMDTPTFVKRSKVGVERQADASAALAGPWLNRWSLQTDGVGVQGSTNFDNVYTQRRQPPSAAAMAIVGSASMKIFPNTGEQIQVTNLS